MSSDCKAEDVIGCVRAKPTLGFGIFENPVVMILGAWLWFLSYVGIKSWLNISTIYDLVYYAMSGLGVVVRGFASKGDEIKSGLRVAGQDFLSRLVYLVAFVCNVLVGWYYRESPARSTILLVPLIFVVISLNSSVFEFPLTTPIVGGILTGLVVNVVIWTVSFFTIEDGNELGSSVFVAISIWIMITILAWYGHRVVRNPKNRRKPGRPAGKLTDGVIQRNIGAEELARREKLKFPTDVWAKQYAVAYNRFYKNQTGNQTKAPDADVVASYNRALPRIKSDFIKYKDVDIVEVALDFYPDKKYQTANNQTG